MKCENNRCISRNRWLWTNIDWKDREEKSAKYRDFGGKEVYRLVQFVYKTLSLSLINQSYVCHTQVL